MYLMYIPRCYGSIYEQDWELATALAVAAFRQQNEFINVLMDAHDKASALLGKGELICEAREILHFYQYQTDSDALDGNATTGDSVFTDIEEEEVSDRFRSADETVVDQSSSSFITSDMTSKHSSCHSADDVRSASAVTAVRTADEFFTINRLSASLRVSQQIINEDSNNGLDGLGDKIDPEDVIDHDDAVEAEADDDSDDDDDAAADDDDVSAELLDMQRKASEMSSSGRWVSSPPDFSSLQKKLYELTIHRDEGEQLIDT